MIENMNSREICRNHDLTGRNCRPDGRLATFWGLILTCCLCFSNAADAEISFTPHLSVGVAYTDNVYLDPTDEEGDTATTVNPGGDLSLTGRNGALDFSYNPTYYAYTRLPENNFWSHSAALSSWLNIARSTRVELENIYLKTDDPISDTDTTVRRSRESHSTNTTTVGMVNSFGEEDVLDLRYVYSFLENDDETIEDSSYHRPSALLTYWFSPNRYALEMEAIYMASSFDTTEDFTGIDARFRFTKRFGRHFDWYAEYGHLITDFLESGEDYVVYSPSVGFIWAERSDTLFSASLGYFYRDSQSGDYDDGLVGSMEMSHSWADGSSFSFTGEVGFEQAYFGAENLGFNPYANFTGRVEKQLGERVSGHLLAGYHRNLYIDEDPDREDTTSSTGGGLTFQTLPWLSCSIECEFRKISSSVVDYGYTENRGAINFTLQPRQGIRF